MYIRYLANFIEKRQIFAIIGFSFVRFELMITFAMNLNILYMKKVIIFLLAGFMMFTSSLEAREYKKRNVDSGHIIPRLPAVSYVDITLNETTGLLTMYFYGDVGNVEMTISQNGSVIDYDIIAGSNGGTATYSFASYAVGEYLLTLETASGFVTQYIINVEDD